MDNKPNDRIDIDDLLDDFKIVETSCLRFYLNEVYKVNIIAL